MFNLLRTIEKLLSLPASIFKTDRISLLHIETHEKAKRNLQARTINNNLEITVVNDSKMYSLLHHAMYKREKLYGNKKRRIYDEFALN